MPMFEYACPDCGYVFERLVLNRKQNPPECPRCGYKRVDQKFSVFATAAGTSRSGGAACAPSAGG
jgi:putative FmdB family regulatory protein